MEIRIDPEFQGKIPPLTKEEYDQLRENILADGEVYEPIIVWNGIIVDGHNRWKIICENPEKLAGKYNVKEMQFRNKDEAFEWMYRKQLGRRNLSDENRSMIIGLLYISMKQKRWNKRGEGGKYRRCQNDTIGSGGRTRATLAKEIGVPQDTIQRNGQFAEGVLELQKSAPEVAKKILDGKSGLNKETVRSVKKMDADEKKELIDAVKAGEGALYEKKKRHGGGDRETRERYRTVRSAIEKIHSEPSNQKYGIEKFMDEIAGAIEILTDSIAVMFEMHCDLVKEYGRQEVSIKVKEMALAKIEEATKV